MSAEVADVLEKAAEVIQERGWCQQELTAPNGAVCALGAIRTAVTGTPVGPLDATAGAEIQAAADAVELNLPAWHRRRGFTLTEYNDAVTRRRGEVIAALRNAAATERARP